MYLFVNYVVFYFQAGKSVGGKCGVPREKLLRTTDILKTTDALIWRKDKYYLIDSYTGDSFSYYWLDRIRRTEELDRLVAEVFGML